MIRKIKYYNGEEVPVAEEDEPLFVSPKLRTTEDGTPQYEKERNT